MVSQQVIQKFNSVGVKPQEQYSFISFCKQFFESQYYKFNRVICHSSDSGVRYTYVIEPTKQEHRYSYIHFFFHYLDKRYHRITYEKLGSPDAIEQNFCVISQIIFSKVKNLVEVPPMHIESVKCQLEDQTVQYLYKVKLNDITKSFPSKTSCIKYMTNELKSVVRSPWSQKENMALIRNLIDRCAKYTCFQTYISRFIFLRIYYFLGSFTFSKLTSDEIFAIFKDFYKVDTQYLLYKPIEDPIPTYFISPSKISGNPETTDKDTLDALYDEFVNSQQDSFEFININHEQTNVPSVFRTT